MFDIAFTEVLVILVIALPVLGPERLHRTARIAGLLLGKANAAVAATRREIERELPQEVVEVQRQARELRPSRVRRRVAKALTDPGAAGDSSSAG